MTGSDARSSTGIPLHASKTPLVAFFLAYPTTPAYPPSAELGAVGGSHVHVMAYKAEKAE